MPSPQPSPTMTTIKAADVSAADLDALEGFVADVLDAGPLAEFLTHLIESLRAGRDMVLISAEPEVLAALNGLTS